MKLNIAARAGRWSAEHWKTAVSAWLAFCVVAIALGSVAGTRMLKQADTAAGETHKAEQILKDAGFTDRAGESVLVQSSSRTVGDPAFRATVADVVHSVSGLPQVRRGQRLTVAGILDQMPDRLQPWNPDEAWNLSPGATRVLSQHHLFLNATQAAISPPPPPEP